MERFVVRVWLPDRPGALGLVASRIGAVRGEIHGIEILEHDGGRAIDELVVELPDPTLIELLVGEVNAVDGVDVEEVRPAPAALRDPRFDAFETATALIGAASAEEVLHLLVEHAAGDLEASWAAVVEGATATVVATVGVAPTAAWLAAVAEHSRSSTPAGAAGDGAPDDVAWASLPTAGLDLVLGRQGRPLRARERHQLTALAGIADLRWRQLSGSRPPHTRLVGPGGPLS
ncbi:MAG: hypothetical protein M3N37_02890 [Actinomycetota bacterium]|nr:hypothetical protein [Actinomycetota bacterium]